MPVIYTPVAAEQRLERADAGFLKPIAEDFLIKAPALGGLIRVKSAQTELKF